MTAQKPLILYGALPADGHMAPALQIAGHLVSRGFDVTFMTSEDWRPAVEQRGAKFAAMFGIWSSLPKLLALFPEILMAEEGPKRTVCMMELANIDAIPGALETVRSALTQLRRENPGREIIVMCDTMFPAGFALQLGANVPGFSEPVKTIGVNTTLAWWTDPKAPPYLTGVPYDDSEAGRERNKAIAATFWGSQKDLKAKTRSLLRLCGIATSDADLDAIVKGTDTEDVDHVLWDCWWACHDVTLQLGIPSLDYPSDTWPKHCKFAGLMPIKPLPVDLTYPEWFGEVEANSSSKSTPAASEGTKRKKIVMVAQGTVVDDFNVLVVPTIKALAHRDDVLVVAVLCRRGATLDLAEAGELPSNVRLVDYFPYDALLAHADVFVSNSGFGGFSHSVINAVPLVQTGFTEDKADVGRRVSWAGLGDYVNPVTVEGIGAAVDRVLGDNKFRERAAELKKEAEAFRTLERVEDEILALAGR